jgi:hypothetical protein
MSTISEELHSAIDEVLGALSGLAEFPRYDDVVPTPHPPATDAEIAALERRIGLPLPPSYRQFLQWHNGYDWLAYPGHMLSIQDASPGGRYWDDLKQWKLETAESGYGDVLDGLVIAYMDQPNNWAYLDPNQILPNGEWAVMLHVPGTDPSDYPDIQSFLRTCASNARLSREWTLQRPDKGGKPTV